MHFKFDPGVKNAVSSPFLNYLRWMIVFKLFLSKNMFRPEQYVALIYGNMGIKKHNVIVHFPPHNFTFFTHLQTQKMDCAP